MSMLLQLENWQQILVWDKNHPSNQQYRHTLETKHKGHLIKMKSNSEFGLVFQEMCLNLFDQVAIQIAA